MALCMRRLSIGLGGGFSCLMVARAEAIAQPVPPGGIVVQPQPWQWWVQPSHSPVEHDIVWLNLYLMAWLSIILFLVAGLLLYVMWRFSAKRHPIPTKTTHNALIELIWTLGPVVFLIAMSIPSFRLVYYEDRTHDPYMTVRVTGHQWYWEYTYPSESGLDFTSYMIPTNRLKAGETRLLAVDHPLVVPVNKDIRILIGSGDVLHGFFIPSLGVQRYAIPGRLIETWVRVDHVGIFYGECNQVCGTGHDSMPIALEALPLDRYNAWVKSAQAEYAANMAVRRPVARPFSFHLAENFQNGEGVRGDGAAGAILPDRTTH
jgi:cytochrome c oxidase subunit 2